MSAVSRDETHQALAPPSVRQPLPVPRRLLRMRSDAALEERVAAGDEAAFDVIYERHRPVVLAVCMGVLGTPHDAEDATQETFSALAVALRTRPPAELRPWLIRVARNASIDTTRRRRHRLLTLDGEIPEVAARPAGSGQAELGVVLDGIRELPEGQRMALLMRELGGHSYAEIADFLETDEEAVKGLIARARVSLRTYREATELSCASARGTIAAEPDGRRYDRTIRRHLRGCGSCRAYREALRGDARALRAALPIQAGAVASGGITSGMLTAAKGSLLGYGLTQAATTCAASACAVGAIGGMVFVAPVHKLGLPPILPAVVTATKPKPVAPTVRPRVHTASNGHALLAATTAISRSSAPADDRAGASPAATALTDMATARRHPQAVHVTRVVLPNLPRHHGHRHLPPGPAAAKGQGNASGSWKTAAPPSAPVQSPPSGSVQSPPSGSVQSPPSGSVQSPPSGSITVTPTRPTGQLAPSNGDHGLGNGRWGAGVHRGNPQAVRIDASAAAAAAGSGQAPPPAAAGAPPSSPAASVTATSTVTTAPSATAGAGNRGHGHNWRSGRGAQSQATVTQNAGSAAATSTQAGTPPTITIDFGPGASKGRGHR